MAISWNEVRDRALAFSRDWANARNEEPDKQTFWNEFFNVFGVPRRSVAVFEHAVARVGGHYGFIDLFWPGMFLAEHKTRGASLDRAESQAFAYVRDLIDQGSHSQVPRYVVVCDFARFALFDLEPGVTPEPLQLFYDGRAYRVIEFELAQLHRHVREFAFIKGETPVKLDPENPANIEATELLAALHDDIEQTGYRGHALEQTLVRLLFCLFAEDTGIFEPGSFTALVSRSRADGRDLGPLLAELWSVLNTAGEARQAILDDDLGEFPYVNGGLFAEQLPVCAYNAGLREQLLACCSFQWARISPAVFGSLFQSILEPAARRQVGAHYTSERDILKVLRGVFLDDLRRELDQIKTDRSNARANRLRAFQEKLRRLRFFDPACGCGNFLILAYRELRRLENEALLELRTRGGAVQAELDVRALAVVDVDQFFGIEIGEWPARIAEVGLWLTDHQMNVELAEGLGQTYRRLPLRATPTIRVGNALRLDWRDVLTPSPDVVVLGNPPFVGKKERDDHQTADMKHVWGDVRGSLILDYVTCWYRRAATYVEGERFLKCAFVSTNSITQGEQVGVLWDCLFRQHHLKIQFAHRTFKWTSEARGMAHVHVVIVGFGVEDAPLKRLFEYVDVAGEPTVTEVRNINPYLVEGSDITVRSRTRPINGAPEISYGSMMIDKERGGGDEHGLILNEEHREALLLETPSLAPHIRRLFGGDEFLNGTMRWCLWLGDARPELIRASALLRDRIEGVRRFRLGSRRPQTIALARTPQLFGEIRQPDTPYLLIPKVSSETRSYIPIGFMMPVDIASGSTLIVPGATNYHFGVLSSAMHNAWMRCVGGRMKSDYQYSNNIIYNNFPWPEDPSAAQRRTVEEAAQSVLDARDQFPGATLADLYDPVAMPAELSAAHSSLDRAVDRCYSRAAFGNERRRVEHLFTMYERLNAPMVAAMGAQGLRRQRGRRPG